MRSKMFGALYHLASPTRLHWPHCNLLFCVQSNAGAHLRLRSKALARGSILNVKKKVYLAPAQVGLLCILLGHIHYADGRVYLLTALLLLDNGCLCATKNRCSWLSIFLGYQALKIAEPRSLLRTAFS